MSPEVLCPQMHPRPWPLMTSDDSITLLMTAFNLLNDIPKKARSWSMFMNGFVLSWLHISVTEENGQQQF